MLIGGVVKAQETKTYWKLITSTNDLIDGGEYLISTSDGNILAEPATNNFKTTSVTISDNVISTNVATKTTDKSIPYAIVLKKKENKWIIYEPLNNKYINGGGKNSNNKNQNNFKLGTSVITSTGKGNYNGVWDITISQEGIASITNQNKWTVYYNSSLIASYSSKANTYKTVGLYKKVTLTTAASSFSTYACDYAVDYSKAGLEAYAITLDEANNKVAYTAINGTVKENTPVLVKGEASTTYSLAPSTETATDVTTALQISDGSVVTEGKLYYGFATIDGVSGFKLVKDGVTIPAKKGYLKLSSSSNAKTFYAFDGDATGIEETFTENEAQKAFAPMYNISGQRVGEGYKGIVIVNGKKYMK